MNGSLWNYIGELDKEGNATGFGKAFHEEVLLAKSYEGTWLNDELHGISEFDQILIVDFRHLLLRGSCST